MYTGFDTCQPFWMAHLKLKRAEDHLKQLKVELEAYANDPPLAHRIYDDGSGVVAETHVLSGPVYASAIIGDIMHNLRSSLDLLACELARQRGENDKNVYFPIASGADELPELIRRLNFQRCGEGAIEVLNKISPFRGGNNELRDLHELDILDKHKSAIPGVQRIATKVIFQMRDGKVDPNASTIVHDPSSVRIVFPDDGPFAGRDVIDTSEKTIAAIKDVLGLFACLAVPLSSQETERGTD